MTLKEFINKAMDIATEYLKRDDHEGYRRCMEIIADAIYEDLEAREEARVIVIAEDGITRA